MRPVLFLLVIFLPLTCSRDPESWNNLEIFGHRGYAGKFPENTIPGFTEAARTGIDGLELDVVISADSQVVVSHEPYMASDYMLDPEGKRISHERELQHKLYQMPYALIRQYDAGAGDNLRFPDQLRISTYKPLLKEVLARGEMLSAQGAGPLHYLIEIKSLPKWYGSLQPEPAVFVDLVLRTLSDFDLHDRVVLQSFDPAILQEIRRRNPQQRISLLVSSGELQENLKHLGFVPNYYSPDEDLVDRGLVEQVHHLGMKLLPWTVNSSYRAQTLVALGADGIITDYPLRMSRLRQEQVEE